LLASLILSLHKLLGSDGLKFELRFADEVLNETETEEINEVEVVEGRVA